MLVGTRGAAILGRRVSPEAVLRAMLFGAGEQGFWFDPSDIATLFQDTAGTTPVTATGQTVGLLLDKSQQQTFAPRVNLLVFSEQFDSAAWFNLFGSVTRVATAGPNGAAGAWTLTTNTVDGGLYQGAGYGNGSVGVCRITVKSGSSSVFRVQDTVSGNGAYVDFNLSNGTAGSSVTLGTGGVTISNISITALGDGWYSVGYTALRTSVSSNFVLVAVGASGSSINVFQPQCQFGSTATAYQATTRLPVSWRGNHATQSVLASRPLYQIDSGGRPFLLFDGTDDWLQTGTITPGVDKAQVFAGVRKLSDAVAIILESSSSISANAGSLYVVSGTDPFPANRYSSQSRGSSAADVSLIATTNTGDAPDTAVITATHDIAGDLSVIRRNGVAGTNATGDKGTGNFLAYPLFIGRRNGASAPFNGRIYGLIARFGANLSADQITATENWVNGKTGAY